MQGKQYINHSIKDIADILSKYYKKEYIFDNNASLDGQLRKYGFGIIPNQKKNITDRLVKLCQWYEKTKKNLII